MNVRSNCRPTGGTNQPNQEIKLSGQP